jgi:adenine-specific DNA-methyltransferase
MAERDFVEQVSRFPDTRYQGSKRKIAPDIVRRLLELDFETALDAFGGTGSVAYAFKCAGKSVTYNDILRFNHQVGLALIENDEVRIGADTVDGIGARLAGRDYEDFIERTFPGVYYTDEENRWLDTAVGNLRRISDRYVRALAWFAVCQAAIAKRPYNLFHRSNLYMRTADVSRSFGNKASWDRTFEDHVRRFAAQANAAVFRGDGRCQAICRDVLQVNPGFDLLYIDPPYISRSGVGVDYRDFYHFLEGMLHYGDWGRMIDRRSKHRRLKRAPDPWITPSTCYRMLGRLFDHFRGSILAMSYRSDGIPTIPEIERLLGQFRPRVDVVDMGASQYALSTRRSTRQVLLIGYD